jgi:hypothetical protein
VKFSDFIEEPTADPTTIEIVGLDAENRNARFPGSLLFGQILPNSFIAGGDQGEAVAQTIQPETWTPVVWSHIYTNTSNVTLDEDGYNWRRAAGDKRASGVWLTIASVAWDNTDPALIAPHRRRMRLIQEEQDSPFTVPWVQTDALFHPDMGDLDQPSYTQCMMQDGYLWEIMETKYYLMRIEVWHNAEVAIDILPQGYDAPIIWSTKLSEL